MLKDFATKLLSLIFVAAGVVAAQSARKDIPAIAKAANGAIVTIIMANNDKPIAQGTGFLVSADGLVLTNYHVIETGNVAIVKFPDGTALPVDGVLASDKVRDLAVIKIHGKTFRTLPLGNSDRVQVGEEVVAIGNPLSLESTVSNGIISGVRTDKEAGGKFLQVTVPFTHGSSGGPLFNMVGEVIGITTFVYEGAGNLNFAIPVNDAKFLLLAKSAKLQNLPNEVEPKETAKETPKEATLPQAQACDAQVEKFIRYQRASLGDDGKRVEYANHYDVKTSKCYLALTSGHREGPGSVLILDAFDENGEWGWIFGEFRPFETFKSFERPQSGGPVCWIMPDPKKFGGPSCGSRLEFSDLVFEHFGITLPSGQRH